MSVFGAYARYYDLLYRDKDYSIEAGYIQSLLHKFGTRTGDLLELGCGTGRHAAALAEKGYSIAGVDLSQEMLDTALGRLTAESSKKISFAHGDIRSVRLNRTFDAAISLFHVFSYQTTNVDLLAAMETARVHLKPHGLLVFDCWYGPAVLTDRPSLRVKRLEDDVIHVTRIAEPVMHVSRNTVDVNYTVFVKDKATGSVEELRETHHMRYLFEPEVAALLDAAGFELLQCEEWLTGKCPGFGSWGVVFVGRKKR